MRRSSVLALVLLLLVAVPDGLCWNGLLRRFVPRRTYTVTFQKETAPEVIHNHFMQLALTQARRAGDSNEVPIGSVIVRNMTFFDCDRDGHGFQVLSAQHNRVEGQHDASSHAEMLAMREASTNVRNWRLLNSTLYSTLEPCPMCLAAAQAFRVDRIVYGAPDHRLGAVGTHINLLQVAPHPFHNISTVISGVCEQECGDILHDFFRRRRKQSAIPVNRHYGRLLLKAIPKFHR